MALSLCNSKTDLHKKELLEYGEPAFPLACYEDDLNEVPVPWHWHDEWEFIYVAKGTAIILLENAQVSISTGDGIFVNSCALHAVDSRRSKNSVLHSAVFHPRLIGGNVESVFWNRLVLPLFRDNAPKFVILHQQDEYHRQMLADFHEAWESVAKEADDYENLTRYLLSRVWRSLCRQCTETNIVVPAQDRVDAQRIRGMLSYIDKNLKGELNAKCIAESVNISESVCLRCFHRMLGISPMQYVKQTRLNKAAELLRGSSMSAKMVALECGFRDISYFTKSFRERMGCTPKEYQSKKF